MISDSSDATVPVGPRSRRGRLTGSLGASPVGASASPALTPLPRGAPLPTYTPSGWSPGGVAKDTLLRIVASRHAKPQNYYPGGPSASGAAVEQAGAQVVPPPPGAPMPSAPYMPPVATAGPTLDDLAPGGMTAMPPWVPWAALAFGLYLAMKK